MKGMVRGLWSKIFLGSFGSTLHSFLPFSPASLTESCSFWYFYGLKPLITLLKLSLTIKTVDVTSGRKEVDPHRQFRGEWVKKCLF